MARLNYFPCFVAIPRLEQSSLDGGINNALGHLDGEKGMAVATPRAVPPHALRAAPGGQDSVAAVMAWCASIEGQTRKGRNVVS
jgi:hypothetical protein